MVQIYEVFKLEKIKISLKSNDTKFNVGQAEINKFFL